jgi:hypothetical protein
LIEALWLLAIQGAFGAFDTLYYHEWRAHLPAAGAGVRNELGLHAARDFIYAVVFATLPRIEWRGAWTLVLAALLAAEVCITLRDFVVEDRARRPLGGVYSGERITHALMGILYGAMLARLIPVLFDWWREPTAFASQSYQIPHALSLLLTLMAFGVALSGARDLYAALGLPNGGWPWRVAGVREMEAPQRQTEKQRAGGTQT